MATVAPETVLNVHHWNETLFSFETTREDGFRFRNGEFVMVGLEVAEKPLLRAYSIASANHEERLEFFSIKVPDGALTSRLQHLTPGDEVLISRKPTGSLVIDALRPGERLFLLATGTLAFVCSLGLRLDIYGWQPWSTVSAVFPGLAQARNVFRFAFFVQMVVVLGAAQCLYYLLHLCFAA